MQYCYYEPKTGGKYMTFGEKLYQLRKERGLSQEALAEKLHTSRQAISKWENNNGYPETEKIILISKIFQITLDDLLMEEREMETGRNGDEGNRENRRSVERKERNEYYVNRETANGFLLYYRKKFLWIAAACGLILGCNGVTYSSTEPGFYELTLQPFLAVLSAMALSAIVFYVILKQNPYRNLRNRELVFSEDVRSELQIEFYRMKKVLLAGIIVCLAAVGVSEIYFAHDFGAAWDKMYLLSEAEILRDDVFDMIFVGVCGFVMIFCAGVYWSYAVLLRDQPEKNV